MFKLTSAPKPFNVCNNCIQGYKQGFKHSKFKKNDGEIVSDYCTSPYLLDFFSEYIHVFQSQRLVV